MVAVVVAAVAIVVEVAVAVAVALALFVPTAILRRSSVLRGACHVGLVWMVMFEICDV